MGSYRLTPRAQQDLRDIWTNIAKDNERAADELLNRLFDKFELVARHPKMGNSRPELSSIARILVEGRYITIYEPTSYGALVVAVVHGMRDPHSWL